MLISNECLIYEEDISKGVDSGFLLVDYSFPLMDYY